MRTIDVFMDSSALMAGIISAEGAARALLLLAEDEKIQIIVSEQVIAEVERNLARKAPRTLPFAREMLRQAKIRIVPRPFQEEVQQHQDWIRHPADVPILAAAARAQVAFLVTLDTRHFIDDPEVSRRSGLKIGVPRDALAWVRTELSKSEE